PSPSPSGSDGSAEEYKPLIESDIEEYQPDNETDLEDFQPDIQSDAEDQKPILKTPTKSRTAKAGDRGGIGTAGKNGGKRWTEDEDWGLFQAMHPKVTSVNWAEVARIRARNACARPRRHLLAQTTTSADTKAKQNQESHPLDIPNSVRLQPQSTMSYDTILGLILILTIGAYHIIRDIQLPIPLPHSFELSEEHQQLKKAVEEKILQMRKEMEIAEEKLKLKTNAAEARFRALEERVQAIKAEYFGAADEVGVVKNEASAASPEDSAEEVKATE
ncbi:hypothetical protein P7C73_g1517, partial [Tremellales sp. Uapishka_1]